MARSRLRRMDSAGSFAGCIRRFAPMAAAGRPSIRQASLPARVRADFSMRNTIYALAALDRLQRSPVEPDQMRNVDLRERIGAAHFQPIAGRERFQGLADLQAPEEGISVPDRSSLMTAMARHARIVRAASSSRRARKVAGVTLKLPRAGRHARGRTGAAHGRRRQAAARDRRAHDSRPRHRAA